MIGLIQRVSSASVRVNDRTVAEINKGILLLVGFERDDNHEDQQKLLRKVLNYRIFGDEEGKMNLSLSDIQGELLVVSQFTLVADTKKGNRPGFSRGASPQQGKVLFEEFVDYAKTEYGKVQNGIFAADMQVALVNDGPVTFWLNT